MSTPLKRGRKPALRIVIDLPGPPQSNSALVTARWRERTAAALNAAGIPALPGAVALSVHAGLPETRRSLAELTATIIGALAERHVIEDPDAVTDTLARWDKTVPAARCGLQFGKPANRQSASVPTRGARFQPMPAGASLQRPAHDGKTPNEGASPTPSRPCSAISMPK